MNPLTNTYFWELLSTIALCCVPVAIVWIIMTAHKKTLQMKYDIIIKSIDNGVKVDPEKILLSGTRVIRKLKWGIVEATIGFFLTLLLALCSKLNWRGIRRLPEEDMDGVATIILILIGLLLVGIVLLSFGVANIVSSSVERKQKTTE